MKRLFRKKEKVVKGTPSAVLLSLAIHVGLFLLAGLFVVFTVIDKPEPKFVPPPAVDRPKMKLKKPQVRLKKSSKPKQTSKIVTKVNKANMPEIQLPEMSGVGDGLAGGMGTGGFDMMPDLEEVTVFGSGQTIGNDFVGTFYDLKRSRSGGAINMSVDAFVEQLGKFIWSGWKASTLSRYYQAPNKLYATSFLVPTIPSSIGPLSFGVPECEGWCWAAHYKGQLVHKEGIKFRFWGQGDDVLVVAVDGKMVLNGSWPDGSMYVTWGTLGRGWQNTTSMTRAMQLGNNKAEVGNWITLEPGVPREMDVLIGEVPGGHFDAMLLVEVEGVKYPYNTKSGGPTLPMFTTTEPSHDLLDAIIPYLIPGEASLTNGPVFSDY